MRQDSRIALLTLGSLIGGILTQSTAPGVVGPLALAVGVAILFYGVASYLVALHDRAKRQAAFQERNRLAQEIHDGLGASISSLIIQVECLLNSAKEPRLVAEICELRTSAEESLEELRRNLQMARADFDLRRSLVDYLQAFGARTHLKVSFQELGLPAALQSETELALFRVLQESLSNCAKHAEPKQVEVKLLHGDGKVLLSVRDNGKGFAANSSLGAHYGLDNLRERARRLGGELLIETSRGHGSAISFAAPLT